MRIVSLLPSATEIVCALGLEQDLVAVTHECDYPPTVKGKPIVTSSVVEGNGSSFEVDRHIRRLLHEGSSIYTLDAGRLQALNPELILTQELCDVCAVSYPIVERAAHRLETSTQLVSLEPEHLADVLAQILLVGRLTGRQEQAAAVVMDLERRIAEVRQALLAITPLRVVCLEWLDPPYNCGHWTPELVGIAGGIDALGVAGQPARAIRWEAVIDADPEAIIVMACGFSLKRTLEEMPLLADRPGWDGLGAVRTGKVFVVDGNAFFSRPGPRLVDSIEILAGLLHPDRVRAPGPERARRWP